MLIDGEQSPLIVGAITSVKVVLPNFLAKQNMAYTLEKEHIKQTIFVSGDYCMFKF